MLSYIINVQAQQVGIDEAKQRASLFFKNNSSTNSGKSMAPTKTETPKIQLSYTSQKNDKVHYYIFNKSNGGFVIVGGDEVSKEIIGYSDKGAFNPNNIPENLKKWLNTYDNEIDEAINEQNSSNTAQTKAKSVTKTANTKTDIAPLIKTNWEQGTPYNDLCPIINGEKCATGCIALAMAQVMNYYRWPETGKGEKRYYDRYGSSQYVYSNFEEHTYQWDLLETKYNAGTEYSNEQRLAISQLVFDCGVSVEMQYDVNGSGSLSEYIPDAMKNYFGYNDEIKYIQQKNYAYTWNEIIYSELAEGRPVIYGGVNSEMTLGHQFICDGYDAETEFFHFNWGWGGIADGYYSLSSLKIENYNIELTYSQDAVIGIKPKYPPTFKVNTNVIDLGHVIYNTPQQATFTITPNTLTSDITMSTTIGSLDVTTIPAGTTEPVNVNVNFTPSHYGYYDGTITLTDGYTTCYINVLCYSGHIITVTEGAHVTCSPTNTTAGKGKEVFISVKTDEGYILDITDPLNYISITGTETKQQYSFEIFYDIYNVGQYQIRFYMPAEPVNIKINSKYASTYEVTWMSNNQYFAKTTTTETYPFVIPTNRPNFPGYDFLGWSPTKNINPDGTNIIYISYLLTPIANTTCYAVFGKRMTSATSVKSVESGEYFIIDSYNDRFYAISGADTESLKAVDITDVVTVNDDNTITIDKTTNLMGDAMRYKVRKENGKAFISSLAYGKSIGYNIESTAITNDTTSAWTIIDTGDNRFSIYYESRNILYNAEENRFRNHPAIYNSKEGYGSGRLYFIPSNKYSVYTTEITTAKKALTLIDRGIVFNTITDIPYGTPISEALTGVRNPSHTGCEFAGWTLSSDRDNFTIIKGDEKITEDTKLYAVYKYKDGNSFVYSISKVYNVNINEYNWSTFYAKETVVMPEGITAYTAAINGNTCILTSLPDNIIPGGTAVVINGNAGQYLFEETDDVEFNGINVLLGTTFRTSYFGLAGMPAKRTIYVLKSTHNGISFEKMAPMESLAENQAFLMIEGGVTYNKSLNMTIDENPNIIQDVDDDKQSATKIFDLNGRPIDASRIENLKGMYIINGKKVFLR